MRVLPNGLAEHLLSGTTTLCHCWRLETRRAEVLGFTDHDRALLIDGTLYEADAGFTATEIESSLGLSVDNLEASGALSSARLSEARLAAGDFDDATIEVWRVNWQEVSQRVLLRKGNLGEVTRGRNFFSAELRGLAHVLNQPRGRLFQFGCDALLGEGRCGIDLTLPAYSVTAAVVNPVDQRSFGVSGAENYPDGYFALGTYCFVSGGNQGREGQIKFHRLHGASVSVELWQELPVVPAAGDQLLLRAGCDKQFRTCRDKFSNVRNFRGFPHMPGDDFVMSYASHRKVAAKKR